LPDSFVPEALDSVFVVSYQAVQVDLALAPSVDWTPHSAAAELAAVAVAVPEL